MTPFSFFLSPCYYYYYSSPPNFLFSHILNLPPQVFPPPPYVPTNNTNTIARISFLCTTTHKHVTLTMLPDQFTRTLATIWLVLITIVASSVDTTTCNTISIYDALASHGLPMGLLPKGVKEFSMKEDGSFEAHLDQACTLKLDNQFEYKKDISGQLSYGRVANLTGMESLELFVWVSVNGIRVDIPNSGRIHFDLEKGVHKELSLSLFETPGDCVAVSNTKESDGVLEYRRFGQKTSRRDVM